MKTSLRWLNDYLDRPVGTPQDAEHLLTFAGFPVESITPQDGGDHLLDVEVTSNRGDCLSHVGLAREIAAASGRTLKAPAPAPRATGPEVGTLVTLDNRVPQQGPLFTLRVITGVKIAPSPDPMQRALVAIGLRPINNVVDVTNFVQHELGNPSHVFDLCTLAAGASGLPEIVVRGAGAGEKLTLLDGKAVELRPSDIVVADAQRARSLAGVMGGGDSGVSERTVDVLVEVATWSPAAVRATARRLNIRSDASHRFERLVDPRTVAHAMDRVCELILATAGGTLAAGTLSAGQPVPPPHTIEFRPARCRQILGGTGPSFDDAQIAAALVRQGFAVAGSGERLVVAVPPHRPDVRLEIDMIEEAGRTIGYDKLDIPDKLPVRVSGLQSAEQGTREVGRLLTGCGFYETVTFSFVNKKQAGAFLPGGVSLLGVSADRRGEDNIIRPSILPSLLLCRGANQDARVEVEGGVRLFELASVYAEQPAGKDRPGATIESRNLALLADITPAMGTGAFERRQNAVRLMRGVIDQLVRAAHGPVVELEISPGKAPQPALDPQACAAITLNTEPLGCFGIVSPSVQSQFGLQLPVVVAELSMKVLLAGYPPKVLAHELPAFPSTERDLSLIVDEGVSWDAIAASIDRVSTPMMEERRFVGTYRGQPLPAGKKSVTLRMVFREASRTLRDEEVNAHLQGLITRVTGELGASVRTG